MTNNKPNTQMTLEFLNNLYQKVDDRYYKIVDADKTLGDEKGYGNFPEFVEALAQENYLYGKNIVNYIGNGRKKNYHNPFENCRLAMIDSSNILYLSAGIKYRDVAGKDTAAARQDALKVAVSLPLKPTAIVDSGVSIQLYWKMDGYHCLSYSYEDLDEYGSSFFISNRETCVLVDAFWLMVNEYAYEAGFQLDNTAVDIDWYEDVCSIDYYDLLPGFVHRFFNKETHKVEEFMVRTIELNDNCYSDDELVSCIENWICSISAYSEANSEEELLRKFIQGYIDGGILYYTLVEALPKTWAIPYKRRGIELSVYAEEAEEWLRQAEADDLVDKEDFYFLYSKEEQASMRMADADDWE